MRLVHTSYKAYLRSMQASGAKVFVFIEGDTDLYFYDKICHSFFSAHGIDYQLRPARELPGNTGGKPGLLSFFEYLEHFSLLLADFKGKKSAAVFFLDKDIDDILHKCIASEHVVYTQYYDVESYCFVNGNLVEAIAAAAALDVGRVRVGLNTSNDAWRRQAAERWKEWVKFCVFTRIRNLNCECNYRVVSRVNNDIYGPLNVGAHSTRLLELERRSGLTPIGFKRVFGRISRQIEKLYEDDNQDLVFKGKWYGGFLAWDARRIAGMRPLNMNGLLERLLSCLQLSLDFEQTWTEHLKQPLERILIGLS